MSQVRMRAEGVDELTADLEWIAKHARDDLVKTVREGIKTGNTVARDFARISAGRHGKHYYKAFTAEMKLYGSLGLIAGEYGPQIDMLQGGMSFEDGSRNQRPHRDLAKSADLIGPSFAQEVRADIDRWFWPR